LIHYLLDANVFIQAKNLHYGFDFCPAFWEWLIERNHAGEVASIEKVADYWLVAHALAHDCTVVTHEVPAGYPEDQDTERLHRPWA